MRTPTSLRPSRHLGCPRLPVPPPGVIGSLPKAPPQKVNLGPGPSVPLRHTRIIRRRRRDLPGSCAVLACMPRSRTPTGPPDPTTRSVGFAFRKHNGVGSRTIANAAQSRGLHASCVRFTPPVTRRGATLGSGRWSAFPVRTFTCGLLQKAFNYLHRLDLLQACLAHVG